MGGVAASTCSCRKSIVSQTIPESNTVKNRIRTESLSESTAENNGNHSESPISNSANNQSTTTADITRHHSESVISNPANMQKITITGTKNNEFSLNEEMYHWATIAAAVCRIHCGLMIFGKTEESLYVIIAQYLVIPPEPPTAKPYDPYDINEDKFGSFIIEYYQRKRSNVTADDAIQAHELKHVLLFACVLYLKYTEKKENRPEVDLDKKQVRDALMPGYNWMLSNKLNINTSIQVSNYKILGRWLKEFYAQKDQI